MIKEILKLISKTEDAKILKTENISGNSSIKRYEEVIAVETELSLNDGLKIILLYITLKEPYSVHFPKIYIDEKSYDELKFIPHINEDLSICIYDTESNFYFEQKNLPEIVVDLIAKSKIILRGKNDVSYLKEEFEREFLAYWNIKYSNKEKTSETGICLIDSQHFQNLKAIKFINKFGLYEYLVYNNEDHFKLLQKYLKIKDVKYVEIPAFAATFKELEPPYNITFSKSVKYLNDLNDFKSKINKLKFGEFLVVFKNEYDELFGWTYPFVKKHINGFRELSNWQFLNSNFGKNYLVNRLSFSSISPKRLDIRTSGIEVNRELKIALIGIGSVGSNLLHYLTKYPISKYCLIDPDILKVENVFRNKFGFNYITEFKVDIGEYEILSKNPFTEVLSFRRDICAVIENEPDVIEDYDFRFIVLGILRIEKYILQHLINLKSAKPIIIIWVEPYLASGQLVYLKPEDFDRGINLISNYPFHVIKSGQNISKKEGSCQTGYMPYSDMRLNLFLSSINSILYEILVENNYNKSKVISWIGDTEELKKINIEINDKYDGTNKFTIIENEF